MTKNEKNFSIRTSNGLLGVHDHKSGRGDQTFLIARFLLREKLTEAVHHIPFMFRKRMNITVERNRRVFMPEDFGQRFHIHAAFQRAGGKRMPQRMKPFMRDSEFFEE